MFEILEVISKIYVCDGQRTILYGPQRTQKRSCYRRINVNSDSLKTYAFKYVFIHDKKILFAAGFGLYICIFFVYKLVRANNSLMIKLYSILR